MKHNHIEEVLLIIAASAFSIEISNHIHVYGLSMLTAPFDFIAIGEFATALVYSSPAMFYLLALIIFIRKKELLVFKKKQNDQK